MQNEKLVLVLLPTFNHEHYVASALESLINQTYDNIRVIISDDASTDKTHDVIMKYSPALQAKCKGRSMYMRNYQNIGAINNFRLLLSRIQVSEPDAVGLSDFPNGVYVWPSADKVGYIQILEGDDWLEPDSIERRVAYLEANELDAVHSDTTYHYENGVVTHRFWHNCSGYEIQSPLTKHFLLMNNRVMSCSLITKAELFMKAYDFDFFLENGIWMCDYAACLRLIDLGAKIGYIDDSLANYRVLGSSLSHSVDRQQLLEMTWRVQEMGHNGSLYVYK